MTAVRDRPDRLVLELLHDRMLLRVVEAADALGLFERLSGPAATVDEVARDLPGDPDLVDWILETLVAAGFVLTTPSGVHAALSGPLLDLVRAGRGDDESWRGLASWTKGSAPARASMQPDYFRRAFLAGVPDSFSTKMAAVSATLVPGLLRYDWEGHRHLLDLGGGAGVIAGALCDAYPRLSATVLELPAVVDSTTRCGQASDRVRYCKGDFFVDALPSADVCLLAHVLVNLQPSDAERLLSRVAEQLPGATLVVVDPMIDAESRWQSHVMSLNAALRRVAGHHSADSYREWLAGAGYEVQTEWRLDSYSVDRCLVAAPRRQNRGSP